jgi:hypothetical protein
VSGADQRPLGAHLLKAAQQELPEPARLFDLPEHRPHNLPPEAVAAAMARPFQLAAHGQRQRPAEFALGIAGVLGAAGCDVGGDVTIGAGGKVGLCSRPHNAFDLAPADADIVEFQVAAGAELGALPATATPRRDGIKQAAQGVAFRTERLADTMGPCCAGNR